MRPAGAAAWLALALCAGAARAAPAAPPAPSRVVRIGLEAGYAPFLFAGPGGAPRGIAVDHLRLLEGRLGVRFEVGATGDLAQLLEAMRRGEIDLLPAVARTPERERFLRFTRPYFSVPAVAVVRREQAGPATLEGLAGRRVAVGRGYAVEEHLRRAHPELVLEPAPNDEACLRRVTDGGADAAVVDLASASWIVSSSALSGLEVLGDVGFTYHLAMATRLDAPALAARLDEGLAAVPPAEAARIRADWVSLAGPGGGVGRALVQGAVALLALALLAWAAVRGVNWALRRKVAERTRALEAQAEELETILGTALDGFCVLDLEGRVLRANQALCELLGHTAAELAALPPGALAAPGAEAALQGHLAAVAGQGLLRAGASLRRRDGSVVEVELSARLLPLHGGRIIAFVHDVSAQRLAEAQLRQSQKMEAVGRLAGGVAHDFNNLLTVIMLGARAGLDEAPGAAVGEELRNIQAAALKAQSLTRQLLAFSRRQALAPRPVDLNEVIGEADRLLRRLIGEHVALRVDLGPGLPPVQADAGQLQQVIVNLAINAQDAMPEGGTLTIRTRASAPPHPCGDGGCRGAGGRCVLLAVEDTGTGMDAATQARLFEPFFTTKALGKGTGLGLSTVFGIVRQSGGTISVESAPGRGSRFTVCLPEAAAAPAPAREAPPPAPAPGAGETVLVLEDDALVRRGTVRMLKAAGFNVLSAGSLAEALEAVGQAAAPALLLTDVRMPEQSGPEAAAVLAARLPGLRTVFMSGYSGADEPEFARLPPDALFLQKPFEPEALTAALRAALDRPVA